jgi:hypothetical protein
LLLPLYGFVQGDALGVVVLLHDTQRVSELVAALGQAASPRVAPFDDARAYLRGRILDEDATLAQAGVVALDRVDLVREGSRGA